MLAISARDTDRGRKRFRNDPCRKSLQSMVIGSNMQLSAEALDETRNQLRSSTMLAAKLECDAGSREVFVRNLSMAGAMIEGPGLPQQGASAVLVRSNHRIPGTIMWRADGRCGLSFTRLVSVEELLPRGRGGALPPHQARADEIQRAVREKTALPPQEEQGQGPRVLDQINEALRLAKTMNETLSSDVAMVSRHGVALQQLDEVEQILRRLSRSLAVKDETVR
jgi:hypothetical protein